MFYGKPDGNQEEIIKQLRANGCVVQVLSGVGRGCPDLLVGYHGMTFLIEVKKEGRREDGLTAFQIEWFKKWNGGPIFAVDSWQSALLNMNTIISLTSGAI